MIAAIEKAIEMMRMIYEQAGEERNPPVLFDPKDGDPEFMIPVLAALGLDAVFSGAQISDAAFDVISGCLSKRGVTVRRNDGGICCSGRLIPGYFNVPADVSSAFVCGMLFSLPTLKGFSVLSVFGKARDEELTGACEKYLLESGIKFDKKGGTYIIPPDQSF